MAEHQEALSIANLSRTVLLIMSLLNPNNEILGAPTTVGSLNMHGIIDPQFLKKNKNYLYDPTKRKAIAGMNAVTASQAGTAVTAAKTPEQKAGSCEAADSRPG